MSTRTVVAPTSDDPPTGLRERKKAATHRAICEAALELIADRGYDDVTIEDIAEAADVSPRTVFNYVGSKDEAVFPVDHQALDHLRRLVADAPEHLTPLDVASMALRGAATRIAADPERMARQLRVLADQPALLARVLAMHGAFERELAAALARRSGAASAEGYPALVAAVLSTVLRVALTVWQADPLGRPLLEIFDTHVRSVAAGLTPPPATPPRSSTTERRGITHP